MKSFIVRLAGALGLIVAIAGPVMAPVASADIKISSSTAFTTIAGTLSLIHISEPTRPY